MTTQDTAHNWTTAETTSTKQVYDFVFTDSSTGYAVADSGIVYKYSRQPTGAREQPTLPMISRLDQNYPNPFNPSTTIRFSIASLPFGRFTLVQLRVYDLIGREVAALCNSRKATGEYTVTWEPKNISSGIYFYRLSYDSFAAIKKIIFLK